MSPTTGHDHGALLTRLQGLAQQHNDQRTQRMMMANSMNQAEYQNMMRSMPNGVDSNNLKRQVLNRNPYVPDPATDHSLLLTQLCAAMALVPWPT